MCQRLLCITIATFAVCIASEAAEDRPDNEAAYYLEAEDVESEEGYQPGYQNEYDPFARIGRDPQPTGLQYEARAQGDDFYDLYDPFYDYDPQSGEFFPVTGDSPWDGENAFERGSVEDTYDHQDDADISNQKDRDVTQPQAIITEERE